MQIKIQHDNNSKQGKANEQRNFIKKFKCDGFHRKAMHFFVLQKYDGN